MRSITSITYTKHKDGSYSGCFGPTDTGKYYMPKSDHRKKIPKSTRKNKIEAVQNAHKSQWDISASSEFYLFKIADESKWFSAKNNAYFSISINPDFKMDEIGALGEFVAKFPKTQNINDSWHGYPVSTEKDENKPCDELIDMWMSSRLINNRISKRIINGEL